MWGKEAGDVKFAFIYRKHPKSCCASQLQQDGPREGRDTCTLKDLSLMEHETQQLGLGRKKNDWMV